MYTDRQDSPLGGRLMQRRGSYEEHIICCIGGGAVY